MDMSGTGGAKISLLPQSRADVCLSNMAVKICIWGYVLDHQIWCRLIYCKRMDIWGWMLAALGLEPTRSPRWILLTEQLFMWLKKNKGLLLFWAPWDTSSSDSDDPYFGVTALFYPWSRTQGRGKHFPIHICPSGNTKTQTPVATV